MIQMKLGDFEAVAEGKNALIIKVDGSYYVAHSVDHETVEFDIQGEISPKIVESFITINELLN